MTERELRDLAAGRIEPPDRGAAAERRPEASACARRGPTDCRRRVHTRSARRSRGSIRAELARLVARHPDAAERDGDVRGPRRDANALVDAAAPGRRGRACSPGRSRPTLHRRRRRSGRRPSRPVFVGDAVQPWIDPDDLARLVDRDPHGAEPDAAPQGPAPVGSARPVRPRRRGQPPERAREPALASSTRSEHPGSAPPDYDHRMATTGSLISLDDVYRARERIGDRLHRTPLLTFGDALPSGRRRRPLQGRALPAHRLVQAARRAEQARVAHRRGEGARRHLHLRRQPRAGARLRVGASRGSTRSS